MAKIQSDNQRNISDVKEIVKKEKKTIVEEPTEDKDAIEEKNSNKRMSNKNKTGDSQK